jgi:hypothetical protein
MTVNESAEVTYSTDFVATENSVADNGKMCGVGVTFSDEFDAD